MCGIFGYVGSEIRVVPLVADALRTMEYRGYDSWGIAWDDGERLDAVKRTGRVPQSLSDDAVSTIAIGHTRWATHGGVTDANAHPHFDASGQIGVVHNGVIENAPELKSTLLPDVAFRSDTDSEIVPHLIAKGMHDGLAFADAVTQTFLLLDGSSAIVAADRESETIAAITARSPLRLGRRGNGWEMASDPLALATTSEEIAIIPDHRLLVINKDSATLTNIETGEPQEIAWEDVPESAHVTRGDFPHFTIKEIHDQPQVVRELAARSGDVNALAEAIRAHKHVVLTGCGSALFAASLGAEWLSRVSPAWIDIVPASELEPHTRNMGSDTLVIALTQSGETADVVDAIHIARSWGATTATIVNTVSSSVANMVDMVVPIMAGVERSVLATKSFMAMAVRLLQLAWRLEGVEAQYRDALAQAADGIDAALAGDDIPRIASHIAQEDHVLVLGKGYARPVAQEAALKIKEGSYAHAEAYLTGELKHGPLALVSLGTPCLLLATTESERMGARIASQEVRSRGGFTIGIGAFAEDECSAVIDVPCAEIVAPLVHLAIVQRLAYDIAVARGVDPDFPRNLAKSVTVR